MANHEQLELLKQDIVKWNEWRRERRQERITIKPDLRGTNLSAANLCGADLEGADLSEANLSGATLFGTRLIGANLCSARLCGAHLSGANIRGANFSEAKVGRTTLTDIDLSSASGLDNVEHLAPYSSPPPRLPSGSRNPLWIPRSNPICKNSCSNNVERVISHWEDLCDSGMTCGTARESC
ncbi:MAG TPA: pentapeptide repeat-containing protein [Blastocatellia bacterium]|nr:pentapeptide repeat-containing protein [Blastocatellia bacterium]